MEGNYGGVDDEVSSKKDKKVEELEKFIKSAKDHPRYKHLIDLEESFESQDPNAPFPEQRASQYKIQ